MRSKYGLGPRLSSSFSSDEKLDESLGPRLIKICDQNKLPILHGTAAYANSVYGTSSISLSRTVLLIWIYVL